MGSTFVKSGISAIKSGLPDAVKYVKSAAPDVLEKANAYLKKSGGNVNITMLAEKARSSDQVASAVVESLIHGGADDGLLMRALPNVPLAVIADIRGKAQAAMATLMSATTNTSTKDVDEPIFDAVETIILEKACRVLNVSTLDLLDVKAALDFATPKRVEKYRSYHALTGKPYL